MSAISLRGSAYPPAQQTPPVATRGAKCAICDKGFKATEITLLGHSPEHVCHKVCMLSNIHRKCEQIYFQWTCSQCKNNFSVFEVGQYTNPNTLRFLLGRALFCAGLAMDTLRAYGVLEVPDADIRKTMAVGLCTMIATMNPDAISPASHN